MVAIVLSLVAIVIAVSSWLGYRLMWDKRELDSFTGTLERVESMLDRMELATFVVAADLTTAQHVVDDVATNLAESQRRADEVIEGVPGEAADAGAQSGVDNKQPDALF